VNADPAESLPLDADLDAEYGQLIEAHWPRLVALCVARGRSRAAAEDIIGEAFVRLHERRHGVRHKAAYLSMIVENLLKRTSREQPVTEVIEDQPTGDGDGFHEAEGQELIRQALSRLPGQQRVVFELYLKGHTHEEIAKILKMNPSTVRSHFRHARDKLQLWWSAEGKERR
jgi:RNA polymerase sigma factor (sigma-70 family)